MALRAVLVAPVAPAGPVVLAARVVTAAEFAVSAVRYPARAARAALAEPAERLAQNVTLTVPVAPVAGAGPTRAATAASVSILVKARLIAKPGWKRRSRSLLAASMKSLPTNNARYPRLDGIRKALAAVKVAVPAVAGLVLARKAAAATVLVVALAAAERAVLQVRPTRSRPRSVA